MKSIRLLVPPMMEPVSLQDARLHLRVDGTSEDVAILSKVTASRQLVELYTRRALIAQTWRLSLDKSTLEIALPWVPLEQVTSVTLDGTVVPTSDYHVDLDGARVIPLRQWPAPRLPGGLKIDYVAGYGNLSSDVPSIFREAVLQTLGHLYANREAQELPVGVKQLLAGWRVLRV